MGKVKLYVELSGGEQVFAGESSTPAVGEYRVKISHSLWAKHGGEIRNWKDADIKTWHSIGMVTQTKNIPPSLAKTELRDIDPCCIYDRGDTNMRLRDRIYLEGKGRL